MTQDLHISSMVVFVNPGSEDDVALSIDTMQGAEVTHGQNGRLVVVLESNGEPELLERFDAIGRLNGVLSVAPVYHHVERSLKGAV